MNDPVSDAVGHAWVDYDDDGDPDLFVSNALVPVPFVIRTSVLYRNDGGGAFTRITDSGLSYRHIQLCVLRMGRLRQRRLHRALPDLELLALDGAPEIKTWCCAAARSSEAGRTSRGASLTTALSSRVRRDSWVRLLVS